jgi:nitrite reductase/ring-hydroxylating ferredoxin subunit
MTEVGKNSAGFEGDFRQATIPSSLAMVTRMSLFGPCLGGWFMRCEFMDCFKQVSLAQSAEFSRRDWIKRFMLDRVVSCAGVSLLFAEVAEATPARPGRLRLRVADYPALQSVGGSVQLQFSSIYAPITVNRVSMTEFATVDSLCTHNFCTVDKFLSVEGVMRCPCHGSEFDARGRVVHGPADIDMTSFVTTYDAATGVIEAVMPNLGLNVNTFQLHSSSGAVKRMRLAFQATAFATYQVHYMSTLGAAPVIQPFSRTPTGAATQTSLTANDDAEFIVYVDATGERGFYAISLMLPEV